MDQPRIIRTDIIQCPECDHIQSAPVEDSFPWPIFVKECEQCKYIIMESEWNQIELHLGIHGEEGRCDMCTMKSSVYGMIAGRTFCLCSAHQTFEHLIHLNNTRKHGNRSAL